MHCFLDPKTFDLSPMCGCSRPPAVSHSLQWGARTQREVEGRRACPSEAT